MLEEVEDVVIVGAGIAGLTTSLGLHRLGHRSLVLESSDSLRNTGFAITLWTNAWKALDAVGIADSLRQQHEQLRGTARISTILGPHTSEKSFKTKGMDGENEARCVRRKMLIETLEKELPRGTIRYSSKVVSIEESGYLKLLHLSDGTFLKTKVLIGCDGVNSMVANWLGFKKPAFAGRSVIRGYADLKAGHGFEPKFMQFIGNGIRSGLIPCDDKCVYWFSTYIPSSQDREMEENPAKMKQFVVSKFGKEADKFIGVVEKTELDSIISSPLRFRYPWELLWGKISNGNVCVAGDALHPMTPDISQGGCAALEDAVVLARCLGETLSNKPSGETKEKSEEEYKRIKVALEKYAKERRWRSFELISAAYMVGFIVHSDGKIMSFLREKFFASFRAGLRFKNASFDCGKLSNS